MAVRTISTRLAIEGEGGYRRSLASINDSLKTLKSELARAESEYKNNANSLSALEGKKKALLAVQEQENAKIKELEKALSNAKTAQQKHAEAMENYAAKIAEVRSRLAELKKSTGDTTAEQEELTKALSEYEKAQAESIKKQEAAAKGVNDWQRQMSNAQREVMDLQAELKKADQSIVQMTHNLKNWGEGLDKAASNLNDAGNKLTMGLTLPLIAGGTASFTYARDTEESLNKVNEAFGESADNIKAWSEGTLTSLGLAQGTALDMAALYGDMATSMGFADDQAAEMSKSLVGLAADLASFKNIGIDVANTALTSIFTGETESLKSLGVVMTETNLKNFALTKGFKEQYSEMDQAQKVLLRYQYVMEMTSNAQGDFARTSDGAANQQRILQEALKEAAATMGQDLLPVVTPVIKNLGELAQSFSTLDDDARKAIVQTGLFLALLGPAVKLTGGLAGVVSSAVSAYQALKTAQASAAAAQTAVNVAMSANPIGAVVTAVGGLVAVLGALAAASALTREKTAEFTDSLEESRQAYADKKKAIADEKKDVDAMVSALTALSEAEHKSTAQKESLLSLVEQLNEAVPSLNLAYDEQTDSLNMTADAIRELALSQAEASERAAAVERLSQLYVEQEKITNELASAEAQLAQAEETKARMLEEGTYWLAENDAAMEQTERTIAASESTIRSMTEAQTENTAEIAAAEEKYGSLAEASGGLAGQTAETAGVIEGLTENAEELEEKTKALAGAQDTLTTALKEQAEGGSLALDTALSLIDAGYGAALAINTETGAVSLNKDAYIAIAKAKIDEQLASLETQRISLETSLRLKDEAYMALSVAQSYIEAKAAKDELDELMTDYRSTQAAIAALNKLKESLNSYSYSSASAARQTASASKTMRTQAQKDSDAFKKLQKDLDHQRAMGEISEKEYYDALAEYRDAYLTDDENLDEYRKINEAIYKHDRQLAEDEKKLWEEQTENLVDELENRVDEVVGKQQDLQQKLEGYGDLYSMEKGPDGKDRMVVNDPVKQGEALSEFEDILTRLKEGGLSDGLMNEILAMDIDEAMEYGKQLLGMSEEQFEAYNKAWDEKQKKALEISARFYAGELETIEKEYNGKLGESLDGLKTTAFTSGEDTVQGLIDGMEEKEQALYEKAQSIIGEVSRLMNAGSAPTLAEPKRDGSHAGGLSYVPFDGYVAELHRGERVLTAEEARAYISRSIPASLEPPVKPQSDMGQMLQTAINAVIGTRGREDAGGDLVIEVPVNGEKLARAILRDFRNVARANPEVKSEF